MSQARLHYTEISVSKGSETQFVDRSRPIPTQDYAPPAPPVGLGILTDQSRVIVVSFPKGLTYEVFHPAPKHQWAVIVSGRIELGVSDGETRKFNAGSVLNIKDMGSKGHTTRVVGEEDVMMLVSEY